ncbi:MAG: hypothetical protein JNK05_38290 [Myxococcales bacterium]|nr:hypothetical protein [Myxococcales bacterium]
MNPIHEATGAQLVLTLFCVAPTLLVLALFAVAVDDPDRRWGRVPRIVHSVLAVGFALLTLFTAAQMHARIDESVSSGSLGAESVVRERFAAEIVRWHESATGTGIVSISAVAITSAIANLRALLRVLRRSRVARPNTTSSSKPT